MLAGYWIVECDSFDRATQIAARLADTPGPEHVRSRAYADVRPWPNPGTSWTSDTVPPPEPEDLLRQLAPEVLGALVRRFGHFDTAEDAVQEALLAAATQWPAEGIPASRAAG